jgi:hypothetical protein
VNKEALERFYTSIQDVESLGSGELIDFFIYYLTVEAGEDAVSAREVDSCFLACDLVPPLSTNSRLWEGAHATPQID